jgi:hypothetical protein
MPAPKSSRVAVLAQFELLKYRVRGICLVLEFLKFCMVRSIALALFAREDCPAEECMRIAVTGAYGFSGRYIARRLLDSGHEVITLTNSPDRKNPFGKRIQAFRYNFSRPVELEDSLRDVDILINNYWVRFDNPPQFNLRLRRRLPIRKYCSTPPSARA